MHKLLTKLDLTRQQGILLGGLGVLTAFVYLFDLGINRWANAYYSAAAQAGSQSWSAFFFGAFNTTGSITVDKPPLSIWFMALSVKLFGLNTYAIILPQALMGVATVIILFFTIKRYFGFGAGLLAGFALLVTPVAALMFRFNNPDALLTLITVSAIWLTIRLNTSNRFRWAILLGVLIGLGFMAKTFQIALILPALFIAFIIFGTPKLTRRIAAIGLTAGTMIVTGGIWFAIVNTIPAADRPYIGGSQTNSVIELAFGYNGLNRLAGTQQEVGTYLRAANAAPGIPRVVTGSTAGAIGWLIPLALLVGIISLVLFFKNRRTSPKFFIIVLLVTMVISMSLVFGYMQGIFHGYYTVQLAPAVAALVGVFYHLLRLSQTQRRLRLMLAACVAVSGIYAGCVPMLNNDNTNPVIIPIFGIGLLAAACLAIPYRLTEPYQKFVTALVIVSLTLGPAFYTLFTVTSSQTGSDVKAGPSVGRPAAIAAMQAKINQRKPATELSEIDRIVGLANLAQVPTIAPITTATVQADADRFAYPVAIVGGQNAAAYQLALNKPVLLMGGFNGSDPSPTFAAFKQQVQQQRIHYFVLSSGGQKTGVQVTSTLWIIEHFEGKVVGNVKLYDLTKPKVGTF